MSAQVTTPTTLVVAQVQLAERVATRVRRASVTSENGLLYAILNTILVYSKGLGDFERGVVRTALYSQLSPAKRTKQLRGTLAGLLLTGKLNAGETRIVSAVVKG